MKNENKNGEESGSGSLEPSVKSRHTGWEERLHGGAASPEVQPRCGLATPSPLQLGVLRGEGKEGT